MKRRKFLKKSIVTVAGLPILTNVIPRDLKTDGNPNKLPSLNPNDRIINITVENKSNLPVYDVMLFGAIEDLTDSFKDENIEITVRGNSHIGLKTYLLQNPALHILGLIYKVKTLAQFDKTLRFDEKDLINKTFHPSKYRETKNMIDMPYFEFHLTPYTFMKFDILGKEKVNFMFTVINVDSLW